MSSPDDVPAILDRLVTAWCERRAAIEVTRAQRDVATVIRKGGEMGVLAGTVDRRVPRGHAVITDFCSEMRWALLTPQWADHMLRFFKEPTSRSYAITYPAGRELCRAYVADEPGRFRGLLTEQVRVAELLDANARS